jgi:hypothetical protein
MRLAILLIATVIASAANAEVASCYGPESGNSP